jgi:hypothetical protein
MSTTECTAKDVAASPVKVERYSRNRSIMAITNNPFELAAQMDGNLHVEILADASPISESDFQTVILDPIKNAS